MKNQEVARKKVLIRTFGWPLARHLQTDRTIYGRFVPMRGLVE